MKKPLGKHVYLVALVLAFTVASVSADQQRAQVHSRQGAQSQATADADNRPLKGQRRNRANGNQELSGCTGQRRGEGRGRGQGRGRGAGRDNSGNG